MSTIPPDKPPWREGERHEHQGKSYSASRIGPTMWMVKRYQDATSSDDESDYEEQEVTITTTDPLEAVEAAIATDSWA
jgi:hypothetical protein